ncbi:MAG: hypothetical protein COT74_03810 [Bdellovibrionales bacterium CG10_big_fil_rev_8_21_14_0_10_45_34]|nr:MAG: hypothetical protein COT74_03810 [Bdellovibrionales bacterium CG10_big_fil_rev_8_21_14_0_10_45_34]
MTELAHNFSKTKVLILSLQRLGDVLQQVPVLNALAVAAPHCEITLVLDRSSMKAAAFLSSSIVVTPFDRDLYLERLKDDEIPIYWSLDALSSWLAPLRLRQFDVIANLTHTKASAHLATLIGGSSYLGAYVQTDGSLTVAGEAFKLLEALYSFREEAWPSLTEFHKSALRLLVRPDRYRDFDKFCAKADSFCRGSSCVDAEKYDVVIQAFASDEKKTWPLENTLELLDLIKNRVPRVKVAILLAPAEEEKIPEERLQKDNFIVCDLTRARDLIEGASVLVTPDTSIKHLASMTRTPVIELALGASSFYKYGTKNKGSYILAPTVDCYPCKPREKCANGFACASQISVEVVFSLVMQILSNNDLQVWDDSTLYGTEIYECINGMFHDVWYKSHSRSKQSVEAYLSKSLLLWNLRGDQESNLSDRIIQDVADDWVKISGTHLGAAREDLIEIFDQASLVARWLDKLRWSIAGAFDSQVLKLISDIGAEAEASFLLRNILLERVKLVELSDNTFAFRRRVAVLIDEIEEGIQFTKKVAQRIESTLIHRGENDEVRSRGLEEGAEKT